MRAGATSAPGPRCTTALDGDATGNVHARRRGAGELLGLATSTPSSRLVAALGLKDYVVVETKDAVLVAPTRPGAGRQDAGQPDQGSGGRSEHLLHREVYRPWGSYDSIDAGDRFQVKRLTVKPGATMSLQLHHHRAEHWIVVSGTARITRGEEVFLLEENQSTYIPIGTKHRIENPGKITLHMIEVQSGGYLGEDDIVRFEDVYGRKGILMARKGIILAGGSGTRLHPLTVRISKQLLPVYDKPMIYYPLSVLMLAGIRDILIITTPHDAELFQRLLGDGAAWGLSHHLRRAAEARRPGAGVPHRRAPCRQRPVGAGAGRQHLLRPRLRRDPAAAPTRATKGATVFGYYVRDPERYGVVSFDADGAADRHRGEAAAAEVELRRHRPVFLRHATWSTSRKSITPSPRGELEITDVNRAYLERGELQVETLGRGFAWLDTGTHQSLMDAGTYVRVVEERQGMKICCPEEIAWRMGFITAEQLASSPQPLVKSGYGEYLLDVLKHEAP